MAVSGFCHDRRLGGEKGRIESNCIRNILDSNMDMHAFHNSTYSYDTEAFARFKCVAFNAPGAQASGAPLQQFLVRYPSSAFMVS